MVSNRFAHRLLYAGLTTVIGLGVVTGCSSESTSASPEGLERPDVTVSVTTVGDFAPVYYALSNGIFEKYGLHVTMAEKALSEVAPLLADEYQMESISYSTYVQAVAQGVPLQAVADGITGVPNTQTGIYVMDGSDIKEPKDLAGRTVAINQPKATFEFNSRVSLSDAGVDPDSVNFQVLPLSSMVQALASGKVDAAYLVPPFSTMAEAQGAHLLLDAYTGTLEGTPIAGYTTTQQFAKSNPKTVEAFQKAVAEASEFLAANPDVYRQFVTTYTEIAPDVAAQLPAYNFGSSVNVEGLQTVADLLAEYNFASKKIDVASTVSGQ